MSKKRFRDRKTNSELAQMLKNKYFNQYFSIFMNLVETTGLTREQRFYLFAQLWWRGTIAAFKEKITGELIFAPYAAISWNMYSLPESVVLINKWGVPVIPSTTQIVNKDVVLGFMQYSKKPIQEIIAYYIDRMIQVDLVINTNINLHKLPYIIGVSPEDKEKILDVVDRILNDELVISTDLEMLQTVKTLNVAPPYIVDKLHAYRIQLENELLTYLGIDNSGSQEKATTMLLDEINANNEAINGSQAQFQACLDEFADGIKEILGIDVSFKIKAKKAEESLESRNRSDGEKESGFIRQNPRGGKDNEEN